MRIVVASAAALLLGLGLWLISIGFLPAGPPEVQTGSQIAATPQTTVGPVALGLALLVGGGLLFLLALRRR